MTVHCPHCATGYILPDPLVGERGARVRCPACEGSFVVIPENGHAAHPISAPHAHRANGAATEVEAPAPAADPADVAADILAALAARLGDDLSRAHDEGRLLSRHGSDLLDAFDEYRRRSPDGEAEAFRRALRTRFGLVLGPTQG